MSEHPTPQRWRRRAAAGAAMIASVAAVTATVWAAGSGSATAGTISGTFYRDPNSNVMRWLAANPNDSRAAIIRDRIGSQPQGRWFANYNPNTITSEVSSYVNGANAANQLPLAIAYMIPNRDCGGASAGGAPDFNAYRTWVQRFAAGLGNRTAVVLLEPDSVALTTCLNSAQLAERNAGLSSAVTTIKQANPNAKVYLDGGHSAWNPASDQANRLVAAGVRSADGFYSNVSNFRTTANEITYGRNVLSAIGAGNLHQVIDTSRNGNGPLGSEWCDPAGRAIGQAPTTNTGESTVDAFVWAKPPGEADGCAAAAGTFVPDLAYQLAINGTPPPTTPGSPSASPSRSPSASPSASRSPSASPSASRSTNPTGCSIAYKIDNQWGDGFVASITITNRGATINGWTLTFTFPGNQRITNPWNATVTQNGAAVSARDAGYNATIPTNGTASFGFQATYSGTNGTPGTFTLNGTICS